MMTDCTLTAQRSPDVLRDATRGRSLTPTPPACLHTVPADTLLALSNWCEDSCCFFVHFFPTLPPFIPSLLLPSFPFSLILPFSSGRYKGRSCWRERACVTSGCTWAPESYCSSWKGNSAEEPQPLKYWNKREEEGVTPQAEREGDTQTMSGSVVLLLSLLLLFTGSDARRIRKRGLNHKVRLLNSPLSLFFFTLLPFILWLIP